MNCNPEYFLVTMSSGEKAVCCDHCRKIVTYVDGKSMTKGDKARLKRKMQKHCRNDHVHHNERDGWVCINSGRFYLFRCSDCRKEFLRSTDALYMADIEGSYRAHSRNCEKKNGEVK